MLVVTSCGFMYTYIPISVYPSSTYSWTPVVILHNIALDWKSLKQVIYLLDNLRNSHFVCVLHQMVITALVVRPLPRTAGDLRIVDAENIKNNSIAKAAPWSGWGSGSGATV